MSAKHQQETKMTIGEARRLLADKRDTVLRSFVEDALHPRNHSSEARARHQQEMVWIKAHAVTLPVESPSSAELIREDRER
jgi:hypothetical protein